MDAVKRSSVLWTIRNDRQLPPHITVTGYADHEESREIATEYESYQEPIYRTIVNERRLPNGEIQRWTETVFSHWETRWRAINQYVSEWARTSEGGGHFHRIPGAPGNRIEKETVFRIVELWRHTDEYAYASWQDNAQPVQFPRAQLLEIKVTCDTILDRDAEAQIAEIRRILHAEGQRHDTSVHTSFSVTVPGFTESISGTLNDQEVNRIQERFGGCCGFTFWALCLLTGYQAVIESCSRLTSAEMTVKCTKVVSGKPGLRAAPKQPDGAAAEMAIHIAVESEGLFSMSADSYTNNLQ
jgi:hypothetical protein